MPVFCGVTPTLGDLIQAAISAGCELRTFKGEFVGPEGPLKIRYLYNSANSKYWVLPRGDNHMPCAPTVVGNMERRLEIVTDYLSMDDAPENNSLH